MSTPGPDPDSKWFRLLTAARDGDDAALGEICERIYKYLLTVARHGIAPDLRTKVGASDIVQSSMLEVKSDLSGFTGRSEDEFRRWVAALLRRNLLDMGRKYRGSARRDVSRERDLGAELNQEIPSSDPNASRIARAKETDEELARAVEGLPARQRQVVEMRHRDEFSYEEIATRLSTTAEAARQLYSRAVRALKQQLIISDDSRA